MGKSTVVRSDYFFVGLNAFEPGQEHAPHLHEGQDKLYPILEGSGVVQIGEESETLAAGDAAYARSGHFPLNSQSADRASCRYGSPCATATKVENQQLIWQRLLSVRRRKTIVAAGTASLPRGD